MARTFAESTEHDTIVNLAASLVGGKYEVYTNPGGEKNRWIACKDRKHYPDIMLVPSGEKNSTIIVEVETEETVTDDHAEEQWKPYSKLDRIFYLLVPADLLDEAKRICRQKAIVAKFGKYWHTGADWKIQYGV